MCPKGDIDILTYVWLQSVCVHIHAMYIPMYVCGMYCTLCTSIQCVVCSVYMHTVCMHDIVQFMNITHYVSSIQSTLLFCLLINSRIVKYYYCNL